MVLHITRTSPTDRTRFSMKVGKKYLTSLRHVSPVYVREHFVNSRPYSQELMELMHLLHAISTVNLLIYGSVQTFVNNG